LISCWNDSEVEKLSDDSNDMKSEVIIKLRRVHDFQIVEVMNTHLLAVKVAIFFCNDWGVEH
jgi:hypothetical protein